MFSCCIGSCLSLCSLSLRGGNLLLSFSVYCLSVCLGLFALPLVVSGRLYSVTTLPGHIFYFCIISRNCFDYVIITKEPVNLFISNIATCV